MLALISVGTMINYLDRAVLGVAAPSMTKELGLDAVVMGIVFSAFSWTYAAAQIPGGAFLDRVGARFAYFWSVSIWSCSRSCRGSRPGLTRCSHFAWDWASQRRPCYPDEQPRAEHMVSSARARARDRRLIPSANTSDSLS